MKILIAPDKFKDALDADGVAEALATGLRVARSDVETVCCPLGDGGEGTGRLLARALGATERIEEVLDPLGRTRVARWWSDSAGEAGIIEMAEASGLWMLRPEQRDALKTSSFGTGQLLRVVSEFGCRRLTLCVGGSATVDGGAGCLQGLGWRLLDARGALIDEPVSGGLLTRIARIEPPEKSAAVAVEILCDVTNPLLGPDGAAVVFGPQKGARPAGVRQLEAGLSHWADVLADYAMRDVRDLPGGGAAGGLPAGLVAALGARLLPGFDEVAARVGLREGLADCDLIITGEGRLDAQTGGGKVIGGVARLAGELGKPTVAFVGAVEDGDQAETARSLGLREIVVVTPTGMALEQALGATRDNLIRAAGRFLDEER